ncbi:hypothetical protein DPMN_010972 [Dreissena polymorpha]|uniref:Uncharacterized protein n=1 Tax=Dreissena polymorpha TaxID=45954 RepID=A0A9D4N448_DREPO|nr:hypothetical protein DPMN_010972 [Dreissena polymorpha]
MGAMFLLWKDGSQKKRLHTISGMVKEKRKKIGPTRGWTGRPHVRAQNSED